MENCEKIISYIYIIPSFFLSMKIQFIPIDYDYFDFQGKNYAKIIGRTENGKRACIIDNCDVYFWAILKDNINEKKIKETCKKIEEIEIISANRKKCVLKTELHDKKFLGKDVKAIKIFTSNYKDAHNIADQIVFKEIDKRREYDLGYTTRYILEKKLKPLTWYEIEGEILNNSNDFGSIDNSLEVDICLKAAKIRELESNDQKIFTPKILSFDIETDEFDIGKGHVLMISLVGKDFKKVLTWKKKSEKKYIESFRDEAEMLEKFIENVKEYDPDILVGYFSDGFDLPYLRARA